MKSTKSEREIVRSGGAFSTIAPAAEVEQSDGRPVRQVEEELTESILETPDDQLDTVFESIRSEDDPERKRALYTVLYEETQLRPAIVRLPLVLEMARQPEIEPSLKSTIMAELGTTLATEHGTSWSNWALAIDEHLANTEGLLRVE